MTTTFQIEPSELNEDLVGKIKQIYGNKRLLITVEEDEESDWWDELPEEVRSGIETALSESDKGKGIPHEEVVKMYPQWFLK